MEVYRVKTGSILPLGKQGENLVRQIQFDLSRWISNFGPGTVQLLHKRSGDETPYPVAVEQDGNLAVWTVTNADTAAAGTGRAELQYYVGDALAKSETWMTKVLAALGPAGETPPEAQHGWVDQVLQAGTVATEAADRAEEAAVRQPYPNAETGTWWVWNAESGAYEDTGISYGTGGSGGGVTDHEKLTGRDKADQHPMIAITGLEDALAGKQPTGTYLTEETDPTVHAWAKAETKPSYTATEVGADPSGTAAGQVSAHNAETTAHSDIRLLIQGLTERLNALADSDDTTLDQLSEIVAYIKSNRDLIAAVTTDKVGVADIIDNLTTNVTNKPLSAAQGVALKALIDAITIPAALPNPNALTFTGAVTGSYDGSAPLEVEIPSGGGGLTVTNTAAVGQTVKIAAVDENGQPTEWEAVDMASREDWRRIRGEIFDGSNTNFFEISTDEDGNAICLKKVFFVFAAPNISYNSMTVIAKYASGQSTLFYSASYQDHKNANCPVVGFIDATTPYFTGYIAKTSGYFNQNAYGFLGGARNPKVVSENITSIYIGVGVGGTNSLGADCTYEIWGVDA